MKLRKYLITGTLFIGLLTGTFFVVSNANNPTKEEKYENYTKIKSEFIQKQNDLKKQIKEDPNNPEITKNMQDLKQKALTVNTLAKEVDANAYYKDKLKSFIASLEGSIKDEERCSDPKVKQFIEEKKKLLSECKKMDIENEKDPKQVYENLRSKVIELRAKILG